MKLRLTGEGLAAAVALVALAVTAVLTQRAAQSQFDSYASTDYTSGGVRAWASLLEREGLRTRRFVLRPIELDRSIDTLVTIAPLPFASASGGRTDADIADLAAWVQRGGRLVYVGRYPGAGRIETARLQLPQWLPDVGRRGALHGPLVTAVGRVSDTGDNRMLALGTAMHSELADDDGDLVVRYALGRGDVIAVSDPQPFTNARVAHAGNARLAYLIARPAHPGGVVAFDDGVHGALLDRPWYRALSAPVLLALAIAALAAVLGLIGGMVRGGAPVTLRRKREPTSAEFVAALAALYERTHARAAARTTLATDAFALAARSVGASDRIAVAELVDRTARRRGGTAVAALAANLQTPLRTDADLLASARLAYNVRKEVLHGGNGDGGRAAFGGRTRTRRRR
ncbi:MAG: hypothetical protein NVSMB64_08800 [Candidatus Velthaea sp.]